MNNSHSNSQSGPFAWVILLIQKLLQRPDSYPIKYYRKTRRVKYYWHNT